MSDLAGGDVDTNVAIAHSVLGGEPGPARDVVLLNAAAALVVAGRADGLTEGVEVAAESLDSLAAQRILRTWIDVSQRAAEGH